MIEDREIDTYVAEGLEMLARHQAEWARMRTDDDRRRLRENHNAQLNDLRRRHDVQPYERFTMPYDPTASFRFPEEPRHEAKIDWSKSQGPRGIGARSRPIEGMS